MRIVKTLCLFTAVLFLFGNCSSDSPNNVEVCTTGDPETTRFKLGSRVVAEVVEVEGTVLFQLFDLIDVILDDPAHPKAMAMSSGGFRTPRAGVSEEHPHEYDSATQYWHFVSTGENGADHIDSIRFYQGDVAVQWPVSDSLSKIERGTMITNDTDTLTQTSVLTGEIATEGMVVLNNDGFYIRSYETEDNDRTYVCTATMRVEGMVRNVEMDLTAIGNDGCPSRGVLTYSGNWVYECVDSTQTLPDVSGNEDWTLTQSFIGNDQILGEYRLNDTCWEVTVDCN